MNPYGILTSYEERMKANLQRYRRPEKAGTFRLRLDHRTWSSTCACSATSPTWTPARRSVWPAGAVPGNAIVKANQYAVKHVDFLIAYIRYPGNNTQKVVQTAKRKNLPYSSL